jgi:tol-pal system protein YbgF
MNPALMPLRTVLARTCICVLLALSGPAAYAGILEDDEARKAILDLRRKFEKSEEAAQVRAAELTAQLVEQQAQYKRGLLDLSLRIEALQQEMATLRGQTEQSGKEFSDLKVRFKEVQSRVGDALSRFDPIKVSLDGMDFTVLPEEKRAFEDAMAFVRRAEFSAAITSFETFRERFSSSSYNVAVNYWLGSSKYQKKDYRDAITHFRAYLSAAPAGLYGPQALLNVAKCQFALGDKLGARKTAEEFIKAYPASEEIQEARDLLKAK